MEKSIIDITDIINDLEDLGGKYQEVDEDLSEKLYELSDRISELDSEAIDKILCEIRFGKDLQERIQKRLFAEHKECFLNLLDLWGVDIPNEIYNVNYQPNKKLNDDIYEIIEDYIEEITRF